MCEGKFPVYFLNEVRKRGNIRKEWTILEFFKEIDFWITIRERPIFIGSHHTSPLELISKWQQRLGKSA